MLGKYSGKSYFYVYIPPSRGGSLRRIEIGLTYKAILQCTCPRPNVSDSKNPMLYIEKGIHDI